MKPVAEVFGCMVNFIKAEMPVNGEGSQRRRVAGKTKVYCYGHAAQEQNQEASYEKHIGLLEDTHGWISHLFFQLES